MNDVADLDVCKELYELSGWTFEHLDEGDFYPQTSTQATQIPAYTLGYLLDKLPDDMHSFTYEVTYRLQMKKVDNLYFFEYSNHGWFRDMKSVFTRKGYDTSDETLAYGIKPVCSDNAATAACKLAIELFKQGVLK